MKKKFLSLSRRMALVGLVALAVGSLAAGCAGTSVSSSTPGATGVGALAGKRVGVSVCCPVPQIDVIANTLKTSVTRNGSGLEVTVVNGQSSTQKAHSDVQTFLAQGFNGIWTTLISGQGYDSLAQQAAAQHVPWINFSGSAVTGATLNIVIPEEQLGYTVGTATADWMIAHGQSNAAIGATKDTTGASDARTTGFIAGVHSKLPNVAVYTVGSDTSTASAASALGANLLQAHPEIKVLYGWVADDAVGLMQAAKAAGNADPKSFLVASAEGNDQIYQLISSNSILQYGSSLGYPFGAIAGANLLEKAMQGQTIPKTAIMRPTLVTPENVALVQKEEADPYSYPERIKNQLAFVDETLRYGQLPTEQIDAATP